LPAMAGDSGHRMAARHARLNAASFPFSTAFGAFLPPSCALFILCRRTGGRNNTSSA
jgi:hypothetical protein